MSDQLVIGVNDSETEDEEVLEGWDKILAEVPSNLEGYVDEEAFKAFYDNQPSYWDSNSDEFWDEFEDSYQGVWGDDEDFAMAIAYDCGIMREKDEWPYTCIDWRQAARDLMHDYWEADGYYFRNL